MTDTVTMLSNFYAWISREVITIALMIFFSKPIFRGSELFWDWLSYRKLPRIKSYLRLELQVLLLVMILFIIAGLLVLINVYKF